MLELVEFGGSSTTKVESIFSLLCLVLGWVTTLCMDVVTTDEDEFELGLLVEIDDWILIEMR